VTPCVLGARYEGMVTSIECSDGWSPRGVETDIPTSERLDDGGGGVSSEGVKRGMVLIRSPEKNDSVGRRKDVSPDVSCSGMEPTDGEGARMDDSYVPLDPRPQLCRLDSAQEGVRYEDVDVSKVSGMLLSSDGASHVVDGGPEPIGEISARLRNPNPGLLRISLERVSRDGPARVVPVPVPVPPVPLGVQRTVPVLPAAAVGVDGPLLPPVSVSLPLSLPISFNSPIGGTNTVLRLPLLPFLPTEGAQSTESMVKMLAVRAGIVSR
jgi:hypothetical protein